MNHEDAIERITREFRAAVSDIPRSVETLRAQEVHGESANGSITVSYSPLGELKNVEIQPDYLRSTNQQRLEQALLEAFRAAEAAADQARDDHLHAFSFMGISIGRILDGGAISGVLPARERIGEFLDRQR